MVSVADRRQKKSNSGRVDSQLVGDRADSGFPAAGRARVGRKVALISAVASALLLPFSLVYNCPLSLLCHPFLTFLSFYHYILLTYLRVMLASSITLLQDRLLFQKLYMHLFAQSVVSFDSIAYFAHILVVPRLSPAE